MRKTVELLEERFEPGFLAYQARAAQRRQHLRDELSDVFPRPGPVVLEIGCGHGHFLTAYSEAHPDHFCVGLDLIAERVRRAKKKRDRLGLGNLEFVRADAQDFLECLPEETRFDRVFVLFPDPWPKKRHHKNRLLTSKFLSDLAGFCRGGADFYFRTDFRPYFEEVAERVGEHPLWQVLPDAQWAFEAPTVFQERAERFDSLIAVRSERASKEVHPKNQENLDHSGDR